MLSNYVSQIHTIGNWIEINSNWMVGWLFAGHCHKLRITHKGSDSIITMVGTKKIYILETQRWTTTI